MPPSLPPRKFAPEPIETSHKSSKDARQQSPGKEDKPKPRRFAVEPVSTEHVSSKDRAGSSEKPKPRKFAVEPVATEHRSSKERAGSSEKPKPRKFAVEPVATEHRSSKDRVETKDAPKSRSLAPQGARMWQKSSKDDGGHIKFQPQPVETLHRTNRKPRQDEDDVDPESKDTKGPIRKFAPILVDSAKRSRRAGDGIPVLVVDDKTESGHHLHAREHRRHIRGHKTPVGEAEGEDVSPDQSHTLDIPAELRRQLSPMDGSAPARRPSVTSQRSHSFRCPELDTIESSESEPGSDMSSLSSSPGQGSPITASDSSYSGGVGQKHATRIRESVDENFSHYLLQLEAKKAEQRMRDLANAAFPNSDFHEPVQHYMDIDDGSDEAEIEDRPVTYDMEEELLLEMAARRESTAKINWEQLEMQRHAEKMEQERKANQVTTKKPSESPWWNPATTYGLEKQDEELSSMRDRARPPMLGLDLVFPRCPSPEPARFDVTQGSTVLRNQMCYLSEHAASEGRKSDDEPGLWHAPPGLISRDDTIKDSATSSPKSTANKGLWGGFCVDDGDSGKTPGLAVPLGPTGLMTPAPGQVDVNPFEQSFAVPSMVAPLGAGLKTPPTPPRSVQNGELGTIDERLSAEQNLDEVMENEFPDSFITQVYNYLSLGYPSLARPFDEELSKISRISMADLRSDDARAKKTPRGYIRLGSDFEGGGGEGITEDSCMRWQALKVYIREWARQEKNMVKVDGPFGNWGTGARRGSWAI